MIRLLVVALCFCCLALSACAGDDAGDSEEVKTLRAAIAFQGDDPTTTLPPLDTEYQCSITVVSPPTPGAATPLPVLGTCKWKLEQQANLWHATFTETWSCAAFSVRVPSYPLCLGAKGTHSWTYLVDSLQQVVLLEDSGNFAPDMAR